MAYKENIEDVVRQFADGMYRLAMHHCDPVQAQDIVQEAFMRLMNTHRTFQNSEHLKAWLYRVVLNLCTDYHRHWWQKMRSEYPTVEPAFKDPSLFDSAQMDLLAKIRKLPAREASAIYLHYYENLPAREIAKILKCREGTVYSLLSRGRSHLKTILEAET